MYDTVAISLHGEGAQTNFPLSEYGEQAAALKARLSGLTREELQRALGVKPMDKSSQYRGAWGYAWGEGSRVMCLRVAPLRRFVRPR